MVIVFSLSATPPLFGILFDEIGAQLNVGRRRRYDVLGVSCLYEWNVLWFLGIFFFFGWNIYILARGPRSDRNIKTKIVLWIDTLYFDVV